VLAQDHAERPDAAGPHHVAEGTRLAAAFELPFVNGPQLVEMVGLVGAGTRIVEAEQAGDQQRGLVVCDAVGARKDAARLAVETLAVGEEHRTFTGKLLADPAPLADEGLAEDRSAGHLRAFGDDEVVGLHVAADRRGRLGAAQHGARHECRGAVDDRVLAHLDVDHFADVRDSRPGADGPTVRTRPGCFGLGHRFQPFHQLGAVAVYAHQVRELAVEAVEEHDFAPAAFVQRFDFDAVAEGGTGTCFDGAHVLDAGPVHHVIVGDVGADVGDADTVPDRAVVQVGVKNAAEFLDAPAAGDRTGVGAQTDLSGEMSYPHANRQERVGHLDRRPVRGTATLSGQGVYFFDSQRPVGFRLRQFSHLSCKRFCSRNCIARSGTSNATNPRFSAWLRRDRGHAAQRGSGGPGQVAEGPARKRDCGRSREIPDPVTLLPLRRDECAAGRRPSWASADRGWASCIR